jgi:hypothetical protein
MTLVELIEDENNQEQLDYKLLSKTLVKFIDSNDKKTMCSLYRTVFNNHLRDKECKELIEHAIWSDNDINTLVKKYNIDIQPYSLCELHCAMEMLFAKYNPIIKQCGETLNSHTWLKIGLAYLHENCLIDKYFT